MMSLRKIALNTTLIAAVAAFVPLIAAAPAAHAQVAYAIGSNGTSLISFNVNTPTTILSTSTLTLNGSTFITVGGQPSAVSLDGIDFRPSNGQLYGYSDFSDTVYTVNTTTGALTAVPGTVAGTTNTNLLGIDFNPVVDRLRLVDEATENVVFNPTSSTPFSSGPTLNDPTNTFSPHVVEAAYTNNFAGATTTALYGIDYGTSSLVTISTTTGAVTTVGSLGVTLPTPGVGTPFVGFDIFSTLGGGTNTAYAILDTTNFGGAPNLYTINLTTGAATLRGAVGSGLTGVYSLAVTPVASAAPEPGSLALLGAASALPLLGVVRRRLRRKA